MIDREQVRKIARLAQLEITPEEEEQFGGQLNSILAYFEQLSHLDTEGVPPTTRAIESSNITRPDVREANGDREGLFQQAPDQDGEFFQVPQILATG